MKRLSVFFGLVAFVAAHPAKQNSGSFEHPKLNFDQTTREKRDLQQLRFSAPSQEQHADFWNNNAEKRLREQLSKNYLNKNMAKNVIFFLGDGMGLATQMASRMYKGGEEEELSFEKFPYSGLSKTYCVNTQVADSACSATAYLSGVKGNYGTIGLSAAAIQGDCRSQNNSANHVDSIVKLAQDYGMRTGVITNTRITHATPAGVYAHVAERYWENDAKLKKEGGSTESCPDIAYQLVHGHVGKRLNVVMGGGWMEFLTEKDRDIDGSFGLRTDTNLIKDWQRIHRHKKAAYVDTKEALQDVGNDVERLLGIFATDHLPYHVDAEAKHKPTLTEMVEKALDILESAHDDKGYLLFVEGGKIDHGHHYGMAKKALDETIELERAVEMARRRTSEDNTLIVVTADHSHSFTVSGYASRGNDILGINDGFKGMDGLPYTTLGYENGPSYFENVDSLGHRKDLTSENLHNDYGFPARYPLELETHGGEDVGVYASGPYAHLFTGVYEQNYIPHAIKYIACLGDGITQCKS